MKKFLLIIIILCGFQLNIQAFQTTTKKEAIEVLISEVFTDKDLQKAIEASFKGIFDDMLDQTQQEVYSAKLIEIIKIYFKDPLVQLYDQNFTEEEIQQLVTWQQSDVAKKTRTIASKMTELMGRNLNEATIAMAEFINELNQSN